ncbi:serine/threonine-protein kinase [Streptomyces sp. ERV7]|uniref:serine/threonine-protein kinase n=1 Tax=Streptomyces sp. ERV7 TaxID=1322334 RepID=UPI000AC38F4A|nr:protein kinase [Streptomyces sp. ERV7]
MEQLTQHDPRRIGPFEVLGRLGAGGMGLVYLARSASGRRVAIKTVRTELAEDQLFRVRFTREVEAARAVSGFYTAAVVDADPRAAVPWLATAYVPAPSLEEIVNECGPLPAQAVRWLAAGIAEALQSIHGAGLVHRDLKPSNVLVVEDGPRVIDFGIASGVSNTRLTMTNVAVGTPAYMSPEQAKDSRSVTGASDVFSLGSTLVFAATGHAPFHGANPVETVFMLLREGPDVTGLPDELRPLIESCMQMEAALRPSPEDLQAQLAPHLFGGSDDSGTASAWLPDRSVAMIEQRRGGGRAKPVVQPVDPSPPPRPPYQPPHQPSLPEAVPDGPVRLAGAKVPIGPGPRVLDGTRATAEASPATGWVRFPAGGPLARPDRPPANGAPAATAPPVRMSPAATPPPRRRGRPPPSSGTQASSEPAWFSWGLSTPEPIRPAWFSMGLTGPPVPMTPAWFSSGFTKSPSSRPAWFSRGLMVASPPSRPAWFSIGRIVPVPVPEPGLPAWFSCVVVSPISGLLPSLIVFSSPEFAACRAVNGARPAAPPRVAGRALQGPSTLAGRPTVDPPAPRRGGSLSKRVPRGDKRRLNGVGNTLDSAWTAARAAGTRKPRAW